MGESANRAYMFPKIHSIEIKTSERINDKRAHSTEMLITLIRCCTTSLSPDPYLHKSDIPQVSTIQYEAKRRFSSSFRSKTLADMVVA